MKKAAGSYKGKGVGIRLLEYFYHMHKAQYQEIF